MPKPVKGSEASIDLKKRQEEQARKEAEQRQKEYEQQKNQGGRKRVGSGEVGQSVATQGEPLGGSKTAKGDTKPSYSGTGTGSGGGSSSGSGTSSGDAGKTAKTPANEHEEQIAEKQQHVKNDLLFGEIDDLSGGGSSTHTSSSGAVHGGRSGGGRFTPKGTKLASDPLTYTPGGGGSSTHTSSSGAVYGGGRITPKGTTAVSREDFDKQVEAAYQQKAAEKETIAEKKYRAQQRQEDKVREKKEQQEREEANQPWNYDYAAPEANAALQGDGDAWLSEAARNANGGDTVRVYKIKGKRYTEADLRAAGFTDEMITILRGYGTASNITYRSKATENWFRETVQPSMEEKAHASWSTPEEEQHRLEHGNAILSGQYDKQQSFEVQKSYKQYEREILNGDFDNEEERQAALRKYYQLQEEYYRYLMLDGDDEALDREIRATERALDRANERADSSARTDNLTAAEQRELARAEQGLPPSDLSAYDSMWEKRSEAITQNGANESTMEETLLAQKLTTLKAIKENNEEVKLIERTKGDGTISLFQELYDLETDAGNYKKGGIAQAVAGLIPQDPLSNALLDKVSYEAEKKASTLVDTLKGRGYTDEDLTRFNSIMDRQKNKEVAAPYVQFINNHPVIGPAVAAAGSAVASTFVSPGRLLDQATTGGKGFSMADAIGYATQQGAAAGEKIVRDRTGELVGSIAGPNAGKVGAELAGHAYQYAVSAAESFVDNLLFGKATDVIMGLNAAVSAYDEAITNGIDKTNAVALGILSGISEAVFEHLSLENVKFFNSTKERGFKGWMVMLLKSSFTNGTEEVFTDIADEFINVLGAGELSNYNMALAQGYTPSQYAGQFALKLVDSFAGGALQGVAFGAAAGLRSGVFGNTVRTATQDVAAGKSINRVGGRQTLIDAAKESGDRESIKLAEKLEKQISEGKSGDRVAGQLYNRMQTGSLEQAAAQRYKEIAAEQGVEIDDQEAQDAGRGVAVWAQRGNRMDSFSSEALSSEVGQQLVNEVNDNADWYAKNRAERKTFARETGALDDREGRHMRTAEAVEKRAPDVTKAIREGDSYTLVADGFDGQYVGKDGQRSEAKLGGIDSIGANNDLMVVVDDDGKGGPHATAAFSVGEDAAEGTVQAADRETEILYLDAQAYLTGNADMAQPEQYGADYQYKDGATMSVAAANTALATYDSRVNPDAHGYMAWFFDAHKAGKSGVSWERYLSLYNQHGAAEWSDYITDKQLAEAFRTGQMEFSPRDGVTRIGNRELKTGEGAFLQVLDYVAKKLHFAVVAADDIAGKNGFVSSRADVAVISLDADAGRIMTAAFHEIHHLISRELGITAGRQFTAAVLDTYRTVVGKQRFNEDLKHYEEKYKGDFSEEDRAWKVREEMAAQYFGNLAEDHIDLLVKRIDRAGGKKLLAKVVDAIKAFRDAMEEALNWLKGEDPATMAAAETSARNARKLFDRFIAEAEQTMEAREKALAEKGEELRKAAEKGELEGRAESGVRSAENYSLKAVAPVEPSSDAWERTLTTEEAMLRFPSLWNVAAEESDTRNPTQVKVTVNSYRKIYDILKSEGFNGTILDASSGLGYGTRAGREEYGFDVDDIEPYPGKDYRPKYKDYSALNKKYDIIISNAVLNVLPQDQRDALTVKMGEMLNDGGRLFVNVRGNDVFNASSLEVIDRNKMEVYISKSGSYQKGFTKDELKAYLKDALGDGFTVETTNKFGAVAAVVTKAERETESSTLKPADNGIAIIDAATESVAPSDWETSSRKTWDASEYRQELDKTVAKIMQQTGATEEQARKYVKDINSIAKVIAADLVRLDYESNVDPNATVLKKNAEYKWSVDMSTLCAKRLLYTGTFDEIQRMMPDTVFTADEITLLRKIMQDKGYQVACGICYVESTRKDIGRITNEFIERYKEAQRTGKPISRITSNGSEVTLTRKKKPFYAEKNYTPTMADLNTTDIDMVKRDHPDVYGAYLAFMNARGQAKPKLLETRAEYKGEILTHFKDKRAVNARNRAGGLRIQSFSDFEIVHTIDMMQIVMDMWRVGLKGQAYTKVPEFAASFGETGIKINLSLIAKGSGLDEKGRLIFDDVEGMPAKEAFALRKKFSKNVGTILVGKNDAHILAAMADPRIDFIIPFHKSSWSQHLYALLGLEGYDDYTDYQNEKPIDAGRKIKNYDPSSYWDYDLTGKENAEVYLQMCHDDGRLPKFWNFLDRNEDGSFSMKEDGSTDGYWKLLIDYKMYDNDGVGAPQEVVRPEFPVSTIKKIMKGYDGNHRGFPVAQDAVDEFVELYNDRDAMQAKLEEYRAENGKDTETSSRKVTDEEYMAAVERGDMDEAQRMVDEAAKKAGYDIKAYHGTAFDFNIFDRDKVGTVHSKDKKGFFFTRNIAEARLYSRRGLPLNGSSEARVINAYLRMTNPLVIEEHSEHPTKYYDNHQEEILKEYNKTRKGKPYDGIIITENAKPSRFVAEDYDTTYVLFSSEQIKSADPVTYDDAGNVIPLSERFDEEKEDIRWSKKAFDVQRKFDEAVARDDELKKQLDATRTLLADARNRTDAVDAAAWESWAEGGGKRAAAAIGRVVAKYNDETMTGVSNDELTDRIMRSLRELLSKDYAPDALVNDIWRTMWDKAVWHADHANSEQLHVIRETMAGKKYAIDDGSFNNLVEMAGSRSQLNDALNRVYGFILAPQSEAEKRGVTLNFAQEMGKALKRSSDLFSGSTYEDAAANGDARSMAAALYELQDALLVEGNETVFETALREAGDFAEDIIRNTPLHVAANDYVARMDELRQTYEGRLKGTKEHYIQKRHEDTLKRADSASRKKALKKIEGQVRWLRDRFERGTTAQHIPARLRELLKPFIDAFLQEPTKDSGDTTLFTKDMIERLSLFYAGLEDGKNQDGSEKENADSDPLFGRTQKYITDLLDELRRRLSDKKLNSRKKDERLDADELDAISKVLANVIKIVREENTLFVDGKRVKYHESGHAWERTIMDAKTNGKAANLKKAMGKLRTHNKFQMGMLKPIYFFNKVIGGEAEKYFNDIREAQNRWAFRVQEAAQFFAETTKKYNYFKWRDGMDSFLLDNGSAVVLSKDAVLQLYVTHEREKRSPTPTNHLFGGGMVLSDDLLKLQKKKNLTGDMKGKDYTFVTSLAQNLTLDDLQRMFSTLSKEQKDYANAVVGYMSSTVAEWGNEASREMLGFDNFTEPYYFPYVVSGSYLSSKVGQQNDIRLKNIGFTHALTQGANKPIVVAGFSDIAAKHVGSMASYSTLALPLDNLQRIRNYRDKETGETIASLMKEVYGSNDAFSYISTFLEQMNGAVRTDNTVGFLEKGISFYKRNAVALNLSVFVQQFSSISRAMAIVPRRYFVGRPHLTEYKELKQYSGVAIVKEMGGWDTDTGRATQQYILGDFTASQKISEKTGWLPNKADEVTWSQIWNAVKRETAKKMGLKYRGHHKMSEEFYQAAAKRFNDVIDYTQVYDSTLSRSQFMRSKNPLAKVLTAFMAEPTTTYNMLMFGNLGEEHKAAATASILLALLGNAVLNRLLKSLVQAWRDWDDDPYWERYIKDTVQGLVGRAGGSKLKWVNSIPGLSNLITSDLNPLNDVVFVKDVISYLQGYEVENMYLSVIGDLINTVETAYNKIEKMGDNADWKDWVDVIGPVVTKLTAFTPIPLQSIFRDTWTWSRNEEQRMRNRGLEELDDYKNLLAEAKDAGSFAKGLQVIADKFGYTGFAQHMKNMLEQTFKGEWDENEKLYNAILQGDKHALEKYTRVTKEDIARYTDEANDEFLATEHAQDAKNKQYHTKIQEALRQMDDRIGDAARALLANDLTKAQQLADAIAMDGFDIQDVYNAIHKTRNELKPPEPYDKKEAKDAYLATYDMLQEAYEEGDVDFAAAIRNDMIVNQGKADKDVDSKIAGYVKNEVENGEIDFADARKALEDFTTLTAKDIDGKMVTYINDAFKAGELTLAEAKKAYEDYTGYNDATVKSKLITQIGYRYANLDDMTYDEVKEMYQEIGMNEARIGSRAASLVVNDYKNGRITDKEEAVRQYIAQSGIDDEDEARRQFDYIDFTTDMPEIDLSRTDYDAWVTTVEPAGVDFDTFYSFTVETKGMSGDTAEAKHQYFADNNSKGFGIKQAQVLPVIAKMPISNKQKDEIYKAYGWSAKKLDYTPWNNPGYWAGLLD